MRQTTRKDSSEVRKMPINFGLLYGGLWLNLPKDEIPISGWTDGVNFITDDNFKLLPYKGRRLLVDLTKQNLSLGEDLTIYGMYEFTPLSTGVPALYVFIGDKLIRYTELEEWENVDLPQGYTIEPDYWSFCTMQKLVGDEEEYLVCVSPSNAVLLIDSSGNTSVPTYWESEIVLKPSFCFTHKGRLVIGGIINGENSLIFSNSLDPTKFTIGNPPSDADFQQIKIERPIKAALPKYGKIIVITDNSVYLLDNSSASPAEWSVDLMFSGIGGIQNCYRTLVDLGNDCLFISTNNELQSLVDTEKFGVLTSSSLSALQVRNRIQSLEWKSGQIFVYPEKRWLLILGKEASVGKNNRLLIYDYGKRGIFKEELQQYKRLISNIDYIAPFYEIKITGGTEKNINNRSCFCIAEKLYGRKLLSGGYYGHIFEEFISATEDFENTETGEVVSAVINAWLIGKYIKMPDDTDMRMISIYTEVDYDTDYGGTNAAGGVILNPDFERLAVVTTIPSLVPLGEDPAIWDEGRWDYCKWDIGLSSYIEIPLKGGRGNVVSPYIKVMDTACRIGNFRISIYTGRV